LRVSPFVLRLTSLFRRLFSAAFFWKTDQGALPAYPAIAAIRDAAQSGPGSSLFCAKSWSNRLCAVILFWVL